MIRARTLGPAEVTVDDAPPPPELLWRKHLGLLVYLARSSRHRTRSHLLGLFWSDRPESAARHSLNEALRILRRVAGPDAVEADRERVRLAPGAVALDVDELESAGADLGAEAALSLIQGEFFEGFAIPDCPGFDDWLAAERRHWRERCVAIAARLGADHARRGDAPTALRLGELARRLDPDSELGVRAMIEILTLAGDAPTALAHYEDYRAGIEERIGAVPGAELAGLAERLRRHGAAGVARGRPPAGPGLAPRAPLVGRAAELQALRDEWDRARGGCAAAAVLLGDLGTGKTRLVEELIRAAVLDGATPVVFRAVEQDVGRPGGGLLGLARGGLLDAPGIAGAGTGAIAALAEHLSDWADRFRPGANAAALPIGTAMTDVVAAALEQAPLLVVIDDAQWCDAQTLAWLTQVLRDCRSRPLLLLVAASPVPAREEIDALRARLETDVPGRTIAVDPLPREAVRQLARALLPGWADDALDRVGRRVSADSGGYPLLAVELLRAVGGGLELDSAPAAWPRPDMTLSEAFPGDLPDTIVGAIRVSFRRLSADAQTVLMAAAALGDRVDPGHLESAAALPSDRFDIALGELEWTRWLVADPRDYTFAARLLRDVVALDFLSGAQRRRFRQRAGWSP